jgi:O-antigen/teichoic acid export membrane protein
VLGFVAARLLGPVSFGQYMAALAFTKLFAILPDFGMSYASTLVVSRDRTLAGRFFGSLLGLQALLSLGTLALCLGLGSISFAGVTRLAVVVLSFDLVLKAVQSTLRWLLKGFELFGVESLTLVAERLALLVLGVGVLRAGHGVAGFVAVFVVVRSLDTTALFAYAHARVVRLVPAMDTQLWGELLRKGLPFAYAGAMITLFFQVDTVILERMRGAQEVGWYRAPVSVLEGLTLVPRILAYALLPTMAALARESPGKVTELYARGAKYLLLVGLPIAAFGVLESMRFMTFLFGPSYRDSVAASQWLLPAAAFMFLSNLGETTLACIDRWRAIVVGSTLALVLNITLNLVLIPQHGFIGAAWATFWTEAFYFLVTVVSLFAHGHRPDWWQVTIGPLFATAAFTVALWASHNLSLLIASTIASTAFVLAALFVWDAKERKLFRDLLGGRPADPRGLA